MRLRFLHKNGGGEVQTTELHAPNKEAFAWMFGHPDTVIPEKLVSIEVDFGWGFVPLTLSEFYDWFDKGEAATNG